MPESMDASTAAAAPTHRRRPALRPTVLLLAILAVVATLLVPQAAIAATSSGQITSSDEKAFLDLVNKERTSRGLAALKMSYGARQVARDWSHTMAADDKLYHRPDLAAPFTGGWTRLGENVGVGWSVGSLHDAFMNSSGHRANVLGSSYRWVGVGVVTMDSGKIWVTFNFGAGDDTVASRFLPDETTTTSPPTSSPTPSSTPETLGDFLDVFATSPFADDVVWLVESAISDGCTTDRFCPDQRVTRAQMAAFLTRALDLPEATETFTDVARNGPLADEIAALAAAGITEGCAPDRFCPDQRVTRAQMAAFLTRALDLPDGTETFTDVARNAPLADEIAALADAGITEGCAPDRFCPGALVPREQMAAFLHRALG